MTERAAAGGAVERETRLAREREHHDELAGELDAASLPPTSPDRFEASMLAAARVGPGTRVLDLGCGSGDVSLMLLSMGAAVTGLDISPGMVDIARRRAELFFPDRESRFVVASADESGLPENAFDAVVGRFILHHVDIQLGGAEVARILAPGGRAAFIENSGRNRILMFARNHVAGRFGVPRLGTQDERPLSQADLEAFGVPFRRVTATYPYFEFFRIFDRQVLRFRSARASRIAARADRLVERRLPAARPYSFRVLVVAEE